MDKGLYIMLWFSLIWCFITHLKDTWSGWCQSLQELIWRGSEPCIARTIPEVYFSPDTPWQAGKPLPLARAVAVQGWAVPGLGCAGPAPSSLPSIHSVFLPVSLPSLGSHAPGDSRGEGAGLSLQVRTGSDPTSQALPLTCEWEEAPWIHPTGISLIEPSDFSSHCTNRVLCYFLKLVHSSILVPLKQPTAKDSIGNSLQDFFETYNIGTVCLEFPHCPWIYQSLTQTNFVLW